MVMTAWKDSKPIHLLSIADSTTQTEKRKHHGNCIEIECPYSIKKYSSEMGGVYQYNKLLWNMANSSHMKKKKEQISFIKELIDQCVIMTSLQICSFDLKSESKIRSWRTVMQMTMINPVIIFLIQKRCYATLEMFMCLLLMTVQRFKQIRAIYVSLCQQI